MLVVTLTELLGIISHFVNKFKTLFCLFIIGLLMIWNCFMPFGGAAHEAWLIEYDVQATVVKIFWTIIVLFWPFILLGGFIRWLLTPGD